MPFVLAVRRGSSGRGPGDAVVQPDPNRSRTIADVRAGMAEGAAPDPWAGVLLDEWWAERTPDGRTYHGPPVTDALVASVEAALGLRLPGSYVAMMRRHNGGLLRRTCCRPAGPDASGPRSVQVHGIFGIGHEPARTLCGRSGSRFRVEHWGYPDLGVYFADTSSAGHDLVAMDYRDCGPDGEPRIVHVDQEWDYRITLLARSFTEFVLGLCEDDPC